MILENDVLRVELDDDYPVIRQTYHKPTDSWIDGLPEGQFPTLVVNGCAQDPPYSSKFRDGRYWLDVAGVSLAFTFALDGSEIVWRLDDVNEQDGGRLETLYFQGHSPVRGSGDCHYRREMFWQRPWDVDCARGIWDPTTHQGSIGGAVPETDRKACTYASVWNGELCITAASSFRIKPVELLLTSDGTPGRTDYAALQMGAYHYRAGDKVLEPFEFRIAFLQDINGDGAADYMDAWIWHRRRLPDPNPIYADSVMYKIFCALPERIDATFEQCRDIVKLVHLVSDGMPQIVYLVGWQYDGHDTGFPALDRINDKLGTREDLHRLVEEARDYNATVSYHINLDDAYLDSPAWDPEIMCKAPDGTVYPWEVFNGRQAYHVCHAKDVESGGIFRRLDAMFDLVPVEKTVHIDALRITNESWEQDRCIGMTEELELGLKPIIEYLKARGIDPSCESIDRFPAELTGLIGCIWHMDDPRLHHGKLLGGGRGENTWGWGVGGSINTDLTAAFDFGRVADMVYLGTRLYQLYLTRELMDLRRDGGRLTIRYGQDGIVKLDRDADTLHVQWGDIEVARDYDRFIPLGEDTIYAYSRNGGPQQWTLPVGWEGCSIQAHTITPEGIIAGPELRVEGRSITFTALAQRPIRLSLAP